MATAAVLKDSVPEQAAKKEKGDVEEPEEVAVEVEPRTGVSFPVKVDDGKELVALGLRKKSLLAIHLKIYSFGIYADNAKLKELLKPKFPTALEKPTKQLYEAVINSDVGIMVRMVMVFGGLNMGTVRKSFDEGLGGSLKKLSGHKDDELLNKVMGGVSDSLKLPSGSEIQITRLPGYILQTKVKGEVVSNVHSELICRAYFHMYLGEDPFDKDAKERFGKHLLSIIQ